jgi:hypothetical protein
VNPQEPVEDPAKRIATTPRKAHTGSLGTTAITRRPAVWSANIQFTWREPFGSVQAIWFPFLGPGMWELRHVIEGGEPR